jgi:hypothetical protein
MHTRLLWITDCLHYAFQRTLPQGTPATAAPTVGEGGLELQLYKLCIEFWRMWESLTLDFASPAHPCGATLASFSRQLSMLQRLLPLQTGMPSFNAPHVHFPAHTDTHSPPMSRLAPDQPIMPASPYAQAAHNTRSIYILAQAWLPNSCWQAACLVPNRHITSSCHLAVRLREAPQPAPASAPVPGNFQRLGHMFMRCLSPCFCLRSMCSNRAECCCTCAAPRSNCATCCRTCALRILLRLCTAYPAALAASSSDLAWQSAA